MAKAFAYLVVGLRFPLVLGWAAAVVAAVLFLPPLPSSGGFSNLIPAGAPAALAYDRKASIPGLLAVIPVPNSAGISPATTASPIDAAGLLAGVRQHTSTIVTYLDFRADATMEQQVSDARAYAARYL